jgi:hypothetical protein
MFFLEFQGDALYVVTPNHAGHEFYARPHGGTLHPLDHDINLYGNDKLRPGKVNSFPTDILQFSASVLQLEGSDSSILASARTYRCRMILPLPKAIFALRSDAKDHFVPNPESLVGQTILTSTGPRVGTITCLEYEPGNDGPYVISYYADHPHSATTSEVNEALVSAREVCGPKFDLKLASGAGPRPSYRDSESALPNGVSVDDEASLEEQSTFSEVRIPHPFSASLRYTTFSTEVMNCQQFGINHP